MRGIMLKVLVAVGIACILVSTLTYLSRASIPPGVIQYMKREQNQIVNSVSSDDLAKAFLSQRNELSKQLNQMKKSFGQLSCNYKKQEAKLGSEVDSRISENGGWCAETSGASSDSHKFDKEFANALSKFFSGKRVSSFGDGPGDYKKHLDKLAEVTSYTAYDGAPFCENTTEGRVKFLDLSAPQYGISTYDWIISVEVGEHIPAQFEDTYLDNLARHAKEGIILSWAVPDQDGLSHVNNQPLEHVISQMEKRGFMIHKEEGKLLRDAASLPWLKANVHIYRRVDTHAIKPEFA